MMRVVAAFAVLLLSPMPFASPHGWDAGAAAEAAPPAGPPAPQGAAASISVLNAQSYPTVGGQWTIRLESSGGPADLVISGADGTGVLGSDLRWAGASGHAGEARVEGGSIVLEGWSGSGSVTFDVLTPGRHHVELGYGGASARAHNQASGQSSHAEFETGNTTYEPVSPHARPPVASATLHIRLVFDQELAAGTSPAEGEFSATVGGAPPAGAVTRSLESDPNVVTYSFEPPGGGALEFTARPTSAAGVQSETVTQGHARYVGITDLDATPPELVPGTYTIRQIYTNEAGTHALPFGTGARAVISFTMTEDIRFQVLASGAFDGELRHPIGTSSSNIDNSHYQTFVVDSLVNQCAVHRIPNDPPATGACSISSGKTAYPAGDDRRTVTYLVDVPTTATSGDFADNILRWSIVPRDDAGNPVAEALTHLNVRGRTHVSDVQPFILLQNTTQEPAPGGTRVTINVDTREAVDGASTAATEDTSVTVGGTVIEDVDREPFSGAGGTGVRYSFVTAQEGELEYTLNVKRAGGTDAEARADSTLSPYTGGSVDSDWDVGNTAVMRQGFAVTAHEAHTRYHDTQPPSREVVLSAAASMPISAASDVAGDFEELGLWTPGQRLAGKAETAALAQRSLSEDGLTVTYNFTVRQTDTLFYRLRVAPDGGGDPAVLGPANLTRFDETVLPVRAGGTYHPASGPAVEVPPGLYLDLDPPAVLSAAVRAQNAEGEVFIEATSDEALSHLEIEDVRIGGRPSAAGAPVLGAAGAETVSAAIVPLASGDLEFTLAAVDRAGVPARVHSSDPRVVFEAGRAVEAVAPSLELRSSLSGSVLTLTVPRHELLQGVSGQVFVGPDSFDLAESSSDGDFTLAADLVEAGRGELGIALTASFSGGITRALTEDDLEPGSVTGYYPGPPSVVPGGVSVTVEQEHPSTALPGSGVVPGQIISPVHWLEISVTVDEPAAALDASNSSEVRHINVTADGTTAPGPWSLENGFINRTLSEDGRTVTYRYGVWPGQGGLNADGTIGGQFAHVGGGSSSRSTVQGPLNFAVRVLDADGEASDHATVADYAVAGYTVGSFDVDFDPPSVTWDTGLVQLDGGAPVYPFGNTAAFQDGTAPVADFGASGNAHTARFSVYARASDSTHAPEPFEIVEFQPGSVLSSTDHVGTRLLERTTPPDPALTTTAVFEASDISCTRGGPAAPGAEPEILLAHYCTVSAADADPVGPDGIREGYLNLALYTRDAAGNVAFGSTPDAADPPLDGEPPSFTGASITLESGSADVTVTAGEDVLWEYRDVFVGSTPRDGLARTSSPSESQNLTVATPAGVAGWIDFTVTARDSAGNDAVQSRQGLASARLLTDTAFLGLQLSARVQQLTTGGDAGRVEIQVTDTQYTAGAGPQPSFALNSISMLGSDGATVHAVDLDDVTADIRVGAADFRFEPPVSGTIHEFSVTVTRGTSVGEATLSTVAPEQRDRRILGPPGMTATVDHDPKAGPRVNLTVYSADMVPGDGAGLVPAGLDFELVTLTVGGEQAVHSCPADSAPAAAQYSCAFDAHRPGPVEYDVSATNTRGLSSRITQADPAGQAYTVPFGPVSAAVVPASEAPPGADAMGAAAVLRVGFDWDLAAALAAAFSAGYESSPGSGEYDVQLGTPEDTETDGANAYLLYPSGALPTDRPVAVSVASGPDVRSAAGGADLAAHSEVDAPDAVPPLLVNATIGGTGPYLRAVFDGALDPSSVQASDFAVRDMAAGGEEIRVTAAAALPSNASIVQMVLERTPGYAVTEGGPEIRLAGNISDAAGNVYDPSAAGAPPQAVRVPLLGVVPLDPGSSEDVIQPRSVHLRLFDLFGHESQPEERNGVTLPQRVFSERPLTSVEMEAGTTLTLADYTPPAEVPVQQPEDGGPGCEEGGGPGDSGSAPPCPEPAPQQPSGPAPGSPHDAYLSIIHDSVIPASAPALRTTGNHLQVDVGTAGRQYSEVDPAAVLRFDVSGFGTPMPYFTRTAGPEAGQTALIEDVCTTLESSGIVGADPGEVCYTHDEGAGLITIYAGHMTAFGVGERFLPSGGSDCVDCFAPTIGASPNGAQLVEGGFSYNGLSVDAGRHHTSFPLITTDVGAPNTVEVKVYENYGPTHVKLVELALGVPDIGRFHSAESHIEVWMERQGIGVRDIVVRDPLGLLEPNVTASTSAARCLDDPTIAGDAPPPEPGPGSCLLVSVTYAHREAPAYNTMGVKPADFRGYAHQFFFNDGVQVDGPSLNAPAELDIAVSHALHHVQKEGMLHLVQTDRPSGLWVDQHGIEWRIQGSRIEQLTLPPYELPSDNHIGRHHGMDRQHPLFASSAEAEAERAREVLRTMLGADSIENPLPGSGGTMLFSGSGVDRRAASDFVLLLSEEAERSERLAGTLYPSYGR